jgi:hypothetical protein
MMQMRMANMAQFFPYLAYEMIEREASALLGEYQAARNTTIAPPIPVEAILEKHLKIGLEFNDTHKLFGIPRFGLEPDILGAIFLHDRRIVVDESLDPDEDSRSETCGKQQGGFGASPATICGRSPRNPTPRR